MHEGSAPPARMAISGLCLSRSGAGASAAALLRVCRGVHWHRAAAGFRHPPFVVAISNARPPPSCVRPLLSPPADNPQQQQQLFLFVQDALLKKSSSTQYEQ